MHASMRGLCVYAHLTKDHQAYVIVNNRSEGNAPLMIQALMRALQ
jgi:hypothetical protein